MIKDINMICLAADTTDFKNSDISQHFHCHHFLRPPMRDLYYSTSNLPLLIVMHIKVFHYRLFFGAGFSTPLKIYFVLAQ